MLLAKIGGDFVGNNLMIIITGASATGKTTLSKALANKLKIPVINKDEIKELLFDNIGTKDEEWAMKLGVTSFELTYLFVEKLCQTGNTFIVEGNFENKYASKVFTSIKEKYNYKVLQIYCDAQIEALYNVKAAIVPNGICLRLKRLRLLLLLRP